MKESCSRAERRGGLDKSQNCFPQFHMRVRPLESSQHYSPLKVTFFSSVRPRNLNTSVEKPNYAFLVECVWEGIIS